jgi:hypothetical protein
MHNEDHTTRNRDARLQLLAAELTSAAYPLVFWRGTEGSWVRMQLGLWKALAETIAEWARRPKPVEPDRDLRGRYEGFLGAVTESALAVARENGVSASCPDVASGLYEAFRQVMRRYSHVS